MDPDDPKDPDPAKGDPDPDNKPNPDDLGDTGKKALDAERKARRDAEKKAKDLETRLKELEDKDKSEADKLRDDLANAQKSLATHEAKALRAEVAMAKGLTPAQARRLVGDSQEELEADADDILENFPAAGGAKPPPPSQKPSPDLKGGTDPTEDPVETDPAKLAAMVPRL